MLKSALVRVRELRKVFGSLSASNFEAIVARLAPLYEDVRIEVYGIAEDTIARLDQMDVRYRRSYFLRKSIGTLSEFAEAISQLEKCPEFALIASELSDTPEIERYWRRASAFFRRNERRLKLLRNDTAGHFGLEAARYAVQNLHKEAVNGIELRDRLVLLEFAGELVATAMLRQASGLNRDHKVRRLVKLAQVGYQHATRCVHCVVFCYLWQKFGK